MWYLWSEHSFSYIVGYNEGKYIQLYTNIVLCLPLNFTA